MLIDAEVQAITTADWEMINDVVVRDEHETLEHWAERQALTLDADGWRDAEHDSKPHYSKPRLRWWIPEARALLARRDNVAAEVWAMPCEPGRESVRGALSDPGGRHIWLEDRGLLIAGVGPFAQQTDFGCEIDRLLEDWALREWRGSCESPA